MMQEIREIFEATDTDGSGKVSQAELDELLGDSDVVARFSALGVTVAEATGLIQLLDQDGSGEVEVEEFISGCLRITGGAKAVDMVTLLYENKKLAARMKE